MNRIAELSQIYCHHCQEVFTATMIDVWMYVNLSVKALFYEVSIAEFIGQRAKMESEYRDVVEIMRRRK